MNRISPWLLVVTISLGFIGFAHSALIDRGNGLIYDSDRNITWFYDANYAMTSGWHPDGRMHLSQANAFIAYLNSINFRGINNWRLPEADPTCVNPGGYDCVDSEMGHLYYTELGNNSAELATEYGPFINVGWNYFWTGTEWAPDYSYIFGFSYGQQGFGGNELVTYYVMLVRDGDVAPPQTTLTCEGFDSPMDTHPVTVSGQNRALPLQARLIGSDSSPITDTDIVAAPVVQVLYASGVGGDPTDVTDYALPAGMGTDGNSFEFTGNLKWQYNLKTKNYSAPGTYTISIVSGDDAEYVINPPCVTSFVIN